MAATMMQVMPKMGARSRRKLSNPGHCILCNSLIATRRFGCDIACLVDAPELTAAYLCLHAAFVGEQVTAG